MKKPIKVDNKLIAKLSKLAKLKFDKKSTEKIKTELKKIIGFVNAISKVDTDNIEPLIYMSEDQKKNFTEENSQRREILKALATIPVLDFFF